ncbi:hypothetical protein LCE31_39640, partial [Streptomyces sp. 8L]|nr:hypothetical protein [Streptomyces sp. 8L]
APPRPGAGGGGAGRPPRPPGGGPAPGAAGPPPPHAAVERPADTPSPVRLGFEALRAPLEFMIDTCLAQGLLTRRLDVDEVFAPARKILGDDAE